MNLPFSFPITAAEDFATIARDVDNYISQNWWVARDKVFRFKPLVSVLLPVYNGEKYISQSIRSLLSQTYDRLEIVVIDDGSNDNTEKISRHFEREDRRVRYLRQPNSGIVDALNHGLEIATGEFIARQDADDISAKTRIEKQLTYLFSHTDCIAVSGGFRDIDENDDLTGRRYLPNNPQEANYTAIPAYEPYLPHPFLMMRAHVLKALRYRYVFHAEDADLYWRAGKFGTLANLPDVIGFYRIHENSISGRSINEGRIQAVFSQLAAISAARVDLLRDDIEFDRKWLGECRRLNSLQDMIDFFSSFLSSAERNYLSAASALKLLEFSRFRPYSLERSDIDFIRRVVDLRTIPENGNRKYAKKMMRRMYADCLLLGRIRFEVERIWPLLKGTRQRRRAR